MQIYNAIIKELKNVPQERLEELYGFIHSLTSSKKDNKLRENILAFGGAFKDVSDEDFKNEIAKTRSSLFDRNIEL